MVIDGFTLFGTWPGLPYDHQVEELVNGLERFKIDRACTLSSQGIFFDATSGNETTWTICQQHPGLIPIGVVDPRIDGLQQVEYCQSHGFRLLSLFPVSQGWSLANIAAKAVLERIAEAKLPVLLEVGRDGDISTALQTMGSLPVPVIFLDVSLPTLTEAIAALQAHPHTYLATRLLCGGDTIESLVQTVGAERLIFTSRFPISCFSSAFLTAKFANIGEPERTAIMGNNMGRLLAL
ncbi:MAG TPA: amidohydrolase family protein [Armatimonadota bacterium]|jgi:predicted TIM-barrel fold metal-dependent hydrolase